MSATRALALAPAERVVNGVHGDAARVRTLALPAVAAGLADLDERRLGVADGADRGAAVDRDPAHLGRGQPHRRGLSFLGDELDRRTGTAPELAARARLQLHVVHRGADRDVAQRERVARADLRAVAALELVADGNAVGAMM